MWLLIAALVLDVGGVQRRYLLSLPAKPQGAPAVLMLHGGGGSAERAGDRGMDEQGAARGFIVVRPDGLGHSWNDGRPIPGRTADDVAFISALIDELRAKYAVSRVFVAGMSNGGFMAFTLACRLSAKIAAIASVAGSMGEGSLPACQPARAVPVLMINGTADPIVRWKGGPVLRRQGASEPVERVTQFWRDRACPGAAVARERLPDRDPDDESFVEVERVRCPQGEVVSYVVRGGGHTWPGGKAYLPRFLVGPVNGDIDATAEILKFFSQYK